MIRNITVGSILGSLPIGVFRPARRSQSDPYQIGYRTLLPGVPMRIHFGDIQVATAEGLNVLAALYYLMQDAGRGVAIGSMFSEDSLRFLKAMGCAVSDGSCAVTGVQPLIQRSTSLWSCGPFVCSISNSHELLETSRNIAESAIVAATEWGNGQDHGELHDAIERLVLEGLFNIFEHAYGDAVVSKKAFVTLTIQPASRAFDGGRIHSQVERKWLDKQKSGLCLEIAISDAGRGVPRTLWHSVSGQQPRAFELLRSAESGTNIFAQARSKAHEFLLVRAFEHDSTQKTSNHFADHYHEVNWRGLYRSRQQVALYGGFISITSGRGRVGFVNINGRQHSFAHVLTGKSEAPGTTLTIRLPVPLRIDSRHSEPRKLSSGERNAPVKFAPAIRSWNMMGPLTQVRAYHTVVEGNDSQTLGIVFPFARLSSEHHLLQEQVTTVPLSRVFETLSQLQPQVVPILFFSDTQSAMFRVTSNDWSALVGYPRLWAVWDQSRQQLLWHVAGVCSPHSEEMISELERTGQYSLPSDPHQSVIDAATELSVNYSYFVDYNRSTGKIRFSHFSSVIAPASLQVVFDHAFQQYWPLIKQEVVTEGPVLVHTGTRVQRYLCVLYLVESSKLLSHSLGHKLASLALDGRLVTDNHGSEFVAKTILHEHRDNVPPINRTDSLELPIGSELVLFADALFRGRTITQLADVLVGRGYRILRVVTVVDLRANKGDPILGDIPVIALVNIQDFDAGVLDSAGMSSSDVQVDRLTHVPVEAEASRFADIVTTIRAKKTLKQHSLFDHGFHFKGDRLHTISIPASKLLNIYQKESLDCLAERLRPFVERHCDAQTDVCFFFRTSSQCGKIVGRFHDVLVAKGLIAVGRSFQVALPTKHWGAKVLFSHTDLPLYVNCSAVEEGQLNLLTQGNQKPLNSSNFVAVFLDDAAVSGKALRNFLFRVASDENKTPKAVMGLLLVNRLSPVELRSFELWRELHPPQNSASTSGIPFELGDILRLQVRSRDGETPADHPLIRRIIEAGPIPSQELREYFKAVLDRLNVRSPVRHVFVTNWSNDQSSLSWDAGLLRHLLSLFQQNEAVLPDILECWERLRRAGDLSLIHMLALEPELLDEPPFNGICRGETVKMCCDVIKSAGSTLADKSDALVVLAWYEADFFKSLRHIGPFILHEDTLRRQFLLFALTFFSRTQEQYDRVRDALGDVESPTDDVNWAQVALKTINRSRRFRQTFGRFRTELEAESPIRSLIDRMTRHSRDAEEYWESLANQTLAMLEDWHRFANPASCAEVLGNFPKACELVEDVFLPAFAGLIYLSGLRGDKRLLGELSDASEAASRLCDDLRTVLPPHVEEITVSRMQCISEILENLRNVTWQHGWSAKDILSRNDSQMKLAPLCEGIRAFYSAPWAIIMRRACVINPVLEQELAIKSVEPIVIVCPVPMLEMDDIVRILLQNVIDHGDTTSLKLDLNPRQEPMTITARNRKIFREHMGGTGIKLAESRAAQYGLAISSRASTMDSDEWITEISFPKFFRCNAASTDPALS